MAHTEFKFYKRTRLRQSGKPVMAMTIQGWPVVFSYQEKTISNNTFFF